MIRSTLALSGLLLLTLVSGSDAQRSPMCQWALSGDGGGTGEGAVSSVEVMPWDASVYDAIPEGAVYIFEEQYVTIVDGKVASVVNAANPGTRDMTFALNDCCGGTARPVWHASGGLNNRSYAEFIGDGDQGIATGFNFDPSGGTNEIAMQVIGRYTNVADEVGYGLTVTTADLQSWMTTFQLRTADGEDLWRSNGHILNPSHNIDYGTPEASSDTGWHLHEMHALAAGFVAFFDGTEHTGGGSGGPRPGFGALSEVHLGGGCNDTSCAYAPVDVHEVIITEGRDPSELEAYRTLRVEPVYGIDVTP